MSEWPDALSTALRRDGRAALVVMARSSGSTPREAGASMVVSRDTIAGTIGGGHLEFEATRLAREAIAAPDAPPALWLVRFPLAARLGQCCGGVATLAIATLDARSRAWVDVSASCAHKSGPFAVVGRVASGDAAAQRIVVTAEDAHGTLGDPAVDAAAIATARASLAADSAAPPGGTGVHALAGGESLLVHVVRPDHFDVLVFGNGHVGRALVQVLGALPARVRWVDVREEAFPSAVPANVEVVATDAPDREVADAPRAAYVVVMTHSHALDFDIVEAALRRDDWRYLGLIGSRAKRSQFEKRLLARGAPPEMLARVTCPIGAGFLHSKEPGAIAVAVAAEMLAVRERAQQASASRSGKAGSDPASVNWKVSDDK